MILKVSTNTFHLIYLFCCFSPYHALTNSGVPFFCIYKPHPTHNSSTRSKEEITLETSAFQPPNGGQFALLIQLKKPSYLNFDSDRQLHTSYL